MATTVAASRQEDKTLKEVKKHVRDLKKLHSMLTQRYIEVLSGDGPLKPSMLAEIANWLSKNQVLLPHMIALNELEKLKYLDNSVRGELVEPEKEKVMELPFDIDGNYVGDDPNLAHYWSRK